MKVTYIFLLTKFTRKNYGFSFENLYDLENIVKIKKTATPFCLIV